MAPFTISDNELSSLRGSVVIVTGGSSGIGLACVELLLAQGANVVIGDLEAPPSNILTGGAVFVPVDVTSWEQLKSMFEAAVGTFGGVDHVFANAGMNLEHEQKESLGVYMTTDGGRRYCRTRRLRRR